MVFLARLIFWRVYRCTRFRIRRGRKSSAAANPPSSNPRLRSTRYGRGPASACSANLHLEPSSAVSLALRRRRRRRRRHHVRHQSSSHRRAHLILHIRLNEHLLACPDPVRQPRLPRPAVLPSPPECTASQGGKGYADSYPIEGKGAGKSELV